MSIHRGGRGFGHVCRVSGHPGGGGGGGGGSSFTPANVGMNLTYLAVGIEQGMMNDIMHGKAILVSGGTQADSVLADTYRDSLGNPTGYPADATAYQLIFNAPPAAGQYKLSWTLAGGTTDPTFAVSGGDITGLGAVSNHSITFTPGAITAGSNRNNWMKVTLPGDGSYLTGITCRPVSGDPGTFLTSQFKSKIAELMPSGAPIRGMQLQNIESNGVVSNSFDGPTGIKYPVDGDTQLSNPILTAANRNRLASPDWWSFSTNQGRRDGFPAEALVNLWTETGSSGWWCCPWNYASTYILGDGTNSGVGSVLAGFCSSTGKSIYAEMANEVWNPGYPVNHQCFNEANFRGQTGQTWSTAENHTACRVVATSNITLSGTQTIDGVSVVAGDRVLVAGQTTASQNGPYVVAAGAWSRAADTVATADKWFITAGTTYANTTFYANTSGTITLGTTALTITRFDRWQRLAEKSAEMWDRLASAFTTAGVSTSKIIKVLSWQCVTSPSNGGQQMIDYLALIGKSADAIAIAPYPDASGSVGTGYTGATSTAIAALKTSQDSYISSVSTWKTWADTNSLQLLFYECASDGSNFSDSTFWNSYYADSGLYTRTHYFFNELRRVIGSIPTGCYYDFCSTPNAAAPSGNMFELIWRITDTVSLASFPKAKAIKELLAGTYLMMDPDATNNGAGSAQPDGTVAVSFTGKGLLPEATFSINDPSGHFTLSAGFSAASGGSIKTVGTGIPAATYNVDFIQTWNGTTHTTTYAIVIAAPGSMNLNFASPAYTVNGTSYGSTLSSIPGYSYTRANSLTVISSGGTVSTYTANTVPINSDGLQSYVGLTNYITNGQAFDNAAWTKGNLTVTADSTVAPDGTTTADTLTFTNTIPSIRQGVGTSTTGQAYTTSWFMKRGTATDVKFSIKDGIGGTQFVGPTSYFALTNSSTFSRIIEPYTAQSSATELWMVNTGGAGTMIAWQCQALIGNFADGGPLVTTATGTPTLSFTFPNGSYTGTATFDDNSTQSVPFTVSSGVFTMPVCDGTATSGKLTRGRVKSFVV